MQTVRVDQLANVLAEAVRDGVRLEQERIIKLLEGLSNPAIPMGELHIPGYEMREVIALIKGEK